MKIEIRYALNNEDVWHHDKYYNNIPQAMKGLFELAEREEEINCGGCEYLNDCSHVGRRCIDFKWKY